MFREGKQYTVPSFVALSVQLHRAVIAKKINRLARKQCSHAYDRSDALIEQSMQK